VSNAVAKKPNRFQVSRESQPVNCNWLGPRQIWENRKQVDIPNPRIMPAGEHLFPEHELELDDNAVCSSVSVSGGDQVVPLLVAVALCDWQTILEVSVPWPVGAGTQL